MANKKSTALAGASGNRLYSATTFISKRLLPVVYCKPITFRPLGTFRLASLEKNSLISALLETQFSQRLLVVGKQQGMNINEVPPKRGRIEQASLIARKRYRVIGVDSKSRAFSTREKFVRAAERFRRDDTTNGPIRVFENIERDWHQ